MELENYFVILTNVYNGHQSFYACSEEHEIYPNSYEIKREMERLNKEEFTVRYSRVEQRYRLTNLGW